MKLEILYNSIASVYIVIYKGLRYLFLITKLQLFHDQTKINENAAMIGKINCLEASSHCNSWHTVNAARVVCMRKKRIFVCFWETVSFIAVYKLNFLQSVSFPDSCCEQGEHPQQRAVLCSFEEFVCLVGNKKWSHGFKNTTQIDALGRRMREMIIRQKTQTPKNLTSDNRDGSVFWKRTPTVLIYWLH